VLLTPQRVERSPHKLEQHEAQANSHRVSQICCTIKLYL